MTIILFHTVLLYLIDRSEIDKSKILLFSFFKQILLLDYEFCLDLPTYHNHKLITK
jgi:hypothetical protein